MWIPLTLRMPALVNEIDAVNYKHFRNLNVCVGYQILLSSGMDAVSSLFWLPNFGMDDVNSTNPKDASPCQWKGCCKL